MAKKMVTVNFEVVAPIEATVEQVREWIAFELNARADMQEDNPLAEYDLEPTRGSVAMMVTNA